LLGELVAGNCDHQLAQDFASLRAQLAAREAGLTELGNELFECKAQLKDADDRLAAREEELRQAREGLGKALEAKRNLLKIEQKARHEEVLELEENFRKAKEYGFRADLEIASLRAALVEAQEESQLISVDCAELKDRLDEARRAPWAREDALVQAQEMCGKYLSVLKRIKGFTKPGTSMADILDEALALTQTPNLYRELTERIKEIEEANERMTRQIKVLVKASEAVAGNPECPEQFSNALYCSVLNAVAIGRKGGE
jgi:chromosome segregation ATPase